MSCLAEDLDLLGAIQEMQKPRECVEESSKRFQEDAERAIALIGRDYIVVDWINEASSRGLTELLNMLSINGYYIIRGNDYRMTFKMRVRKETE